MKISRSVVLAIWAAGSASAQRVGEPTADLDKVSVDELFSIQVTSVGRKAQQISKAPAAVFVLTADDIRRSGATSIPEALQWVPGLTVLRLNGRSWAVSARGGARVYSDRILVMIDGRSLYSPLFSGVIWDAIDVPLEDIERIEVVRGPGAVMWGPNAVNGVINIITKPARATKGAASSVAAGNEARGAAEARWGGAAGDRLAYRVWGKTDYLTPAYGSPGTFYFGNFAYRDPSVTNLDAATGRFGFRFDAQPGDRDQLMVEGDLYKTGRQDPLAYPAVWPNVVRQQGHTDYEGGYIQARWTRTAAAGNESVLQFTYDDNHIDYPFVGGGLNNLTIDFQKRRQTGERNELYWGVGLQQYWDATYSNRYVSFQPADAVYRTGDVVLRDEWQIVPAKLVGSAGVRVDYNSYHHVEYQPSVRLLYTPDRRQSAWLAVSRAVRVPSRVDRDVLYDNGQMPSPAGPIQVFVSGSQAAPSETERSLEAGYRLQSGQHWSVDLSAFGSYYERLRAAEGPLLPVLAVTAGKRSLTLPLSVVNSGAGRAYGGEVWATWQARPGWRLIPSYSYVKDSEWLPAAPGRRLVWERTPEDLRHQGLLRSQHDLWRNVQLDLMARARSRDLNFNLPGVLLLDARLSWRPSRAAEVSVSVENLANRSVLECYPEIATPAIPLRRMFVIKWTQRL
ncbi:MAG: TonB-dependent receptor plug domain-containing protein [Acidobacteriia bacterium]|nr:TonB-dependent receptor plug domain-containing protein [Terriglobia bacterium]